MGMILVEPDLASEKVPTLGTKPQAFSEGKLFTGRGRIRHYPDDPPPFPHMNNKIRINIPK